MQGIAGIVEFTGESISPDALPWMLAASSLKPANRTEIWQTNEVALGHIRDQNILPQDPLDLQPLRLEGDAGVLVTASYLYNRHELAAEFAWRADEVEAKPDSAFVRAAYERWGESAPSHLTGVFSL